MAKKKRQPKISLVPSPEPATQIVSDLNTLALMQCYAKISLYAAEQAILSLAQGEQPHAKYYKAISDRFIQQANTNVDKIQDPQIKANLR